MYEDETGRRNAAGYPDPTYHGAARGIERGGADRCAACVRAMRAVASALGCEVIGRVAVRDRETGYVSR